MKKFLLFIVEGQNDQREIEAIINTFCKEALISKKYSPFFLSHSGDITADNRTTGDKVAGAIEKKILQFRNDGIPYRRIKVSDIAAVIHIVDTDGAFIPHDSIKEADVGDFTYYDETIECPNRNIGIQRNANKSKALNKLINLSQIGGIPYQIYFVSCNMDHLLYGERNPPKHKKNEFARSFASMCNKSGTKYSDILPNEFTVDGNYDETWTFIRQGTNSLSRATNLDLFFRSYLGITPGKE